MIPSLVITLVRVYKPPNTTSFDFHDDFLDCILDMIALDNNIMIMGDFNHHINKELDEDASNFMESMSLVGLVQHVDCRTHESDNILDLVFTESSNEFSVLRCRSGPFVSVHCMVMCDMVLAKPEIKCRDIMFHDLDSIDPELMASAIKIKDTFLDFTPPEFENWVIQFEEALSQVFDKYAPVQTKTILEKNKVPWFTKSVKEFKQKMTQREKLWRKYKRDKF